MPMTVQKVSLLQNFLKYFEVAEMVGTAIPNSHVSAIAGLLEQLTAELQGAKILPDVGVLPSPGPVPVPEPTPGPVPVPTPAPVMPDGPIPIKN